MKRSIVVDDDDAGVKVDVSGDVDEVVNKAVDVVVIDVVVVVDVDIDVLLSLGHFGIYCNRAVNFFVPFSFLDVDFDGRLSLSAFQQRDASTERQ